MALGFVSMVTELVLSRRKKVLGRLEVYTILLLNSKLLLLVVMRLFVQRLDCSLRFYRLRFEY